MGAEDGPSDPNRAAPKQTTGKTARGDKDVGAALRSVYQKTVEEQIPDEFLDLLGKLG